MSTHAKTAVGTITGSQTSKLEKLLAHLETQAEAVRMVLGMMNGHEIAKKADRQSTVINQALQIDGARRAKTAARKNPGPGPARDAEVAARTQALLNVLHHDKPTTSTDAITAVKAQTGIDLKGQALGRLVRDKYAKKKGDGYVRTNKEFHPPQQEA